VGEVVKSGVDIITFSGDKLLGGPQAGIIVGKREFIEQIRTNPMNRALRIDKFTLAGLEAVLRIYLDGKTAAGRIPTLAMLGAGSDELKKKERRLIRLCKGTKANCQLVPVTSRAGGGALPDQDLPGYGVAVEPAGMSVSELETRLRRLALPVIGRIEDDRLILDLRTVAGHEIKPLAEGLAEALGEAG